MKISGRKETIDWYNQNAEQYSANTRDKTFEENAGQFLSQISAETPIILDAGCGDGRDSATLTSFGAKVTGVDLSKGLIEVARQLHPEIDFIVGDFLSLPFPDNTFNGIWSHASLVHLETVAEVEKVLTEFYRVARPGGTLYICTKEQTGESETEVVADSLSNHDRFFRYYTEQGLTEALTKAGFRIDSVVREGDVHGRAEISWLRVLVTKK